MLAEHKPALLQRQNATGQTPLEASREAHYSKVLLRPPSLYPQDTRRIWRGRHFAYSSIADVSIADIPVTDFATRQNETPWDRMSDVEKTWRVCEEIARREENKGIKRKLVTPSEANGVAKRLVKQQEKRSKEAEAAVATMGRYQSRNRHRLQYGHDYDEDDDQIDRWLKEKKQ